MTTVKDKNIEDLEFIKNINLEEYFYENKLGDVIGVSEYIRPKSIGPNDTFNQVSGISGISGISVLPWFWR